MKDYVKPVVLVNEELAEGVYAASGAGDCWSIGVTSDQEWNGKGHTFRIQINHSDKVEHISTQSTAVLTFNYPVEVKECEFPAVANGNTVTITRTQHANAYQSGDQANYLLVVSTGDEATTRALACTGKKIMDTGITENVQGKGGNGE